MSMSASDKYNREQKKRQGRISRIMTLQGKLGSVSYTSAELSTMYTPQIKQLEKTLKEMLKVQQAT